MQSTQTDDEGNYAFTDVAAGVYTVEVLDLRQNLDEDAILYNSSNTDIVVAYGYLATNNYNCMADQKMYDFTGKGRVQFTLTWGTEVRNTPPFTRRPMEFIGSISVITPREM